MDGGRRQLMRTRTWHVWDSTVLASASEHRPGFPTDATMDGTSRTGRVIELDLPKTVADRPGALLQENPVAPAQLLRQVRREDEPARELLLFLIRRVARCREQSEAAGACARRCQPNRPAAPSR